MNPTPHFPDNENGQILRQMFDGGNDLTQPRIVDLCFIFPDAEQALSFVREVTDQTVKTCLSWYQGKSMWQVIVKYNMVPEHEAITTLEGNLTFQAQRVGGKADGWGCMQITKS